MTRTVEEIILEIEERIKHVSDIIKSDREEGFSADGVSIGAIDELHDLLDWIKKDDNEEH